MKVGQKSGSPKMFSDIPDKRLEVRLPMEEFTAFAQRGRFGEEEISLLKEIRSNIT